MSDPQMMECSVCGAYAGKWQQWWNQDDTYGVCEGCVNWLVTERNHTINQINTLYGKAGVHRPRAKCEEVAQ